MAKSIVQLSKLSRGRGEDKGSYIQVVYDDEVIFFARVPICF